ncbi:hypothetical protein HYH02_013296 [Chlamydomonas schloesseri]|uniref:Elongator complex protein 1 n=1 Tax=Chlamydomonas schloesseri TaxID=2026947 RepID=A0A835SR19_9CHLO|nr:hypothetical protein HYH02_013296 [Chlamydomonas schloesseri]|eukprot:KAG2431603.1 hypothetical protein HYH02_013296 [Chlamydomonas schloesseri]
MKNLIVERDFCALLDQTEDGAVASFCLNAAESTMYTISESGVVACYTVGETLKFVWRVDVGPELLAAEVDADPAVAAVATATVGGCGWLASFSHVLELDALCIATRAGTLALLHVAEGEQPHLEQVGQVDVGLVAVEWSPDGELMAALSGAGGLLVMNQAWELMLEAPALGPPTPAAASAAAAAAAAAAGATADAAPGPRYADGAISWRGDGKFFAVMCRDAAAVTAVDAEAAPPPYRVRIWDRTTLEPHSAGEPFDCLLPLPAWQPNGRHLYVAAAGATAAAVSAGAPAPSSAAVAWGGSGSSSSSSSSAAGPAVLMYERNGLRHGGFSLPGSAPVVGLAWSCDSELLAVVNAPGPAPAAAQAATVTQQAPQEGSSGEEAGSEEGYVVQLWHRSNWHWYLKHERRYAPAPGGSGGSGGAGASGGGSGRPPLLRWDEQRGGVLHVVSPAGSYEQVALAWDTVASDLGTAAVVDGRRLLLSPLRQGLVPPPMCAAAVALPQAAVDVAIAALPATVPPAGATAAAAATAATAVDEVVAVLTSGGRLAVARAVEEDLWQETLEDQEALIAELDGAAPAAVAAASAAAVTTGRLLQPAVPRLGVPLAGGRRARALTWLTTPVAAAAAGSSGSSSGSGTQPQLQPSSLLVLAAPYPEPGLEEGAGDVLVQVDVAWLSCGPADPADPRPRPELLLTERPHVYAGGRVLRIAPHVAGGAAVELATGAVLRYVPAPPSSDPQSPGRLVSCGPAAALPAPCAVVRPLPPSSPFGPDAAPLLGLTRGGRLCWGGAVVAPADVTSFALRAYGPGGPALLYTTRKNLLYTVLLAQLPGYSHRDLTADPASHYLNRHEGDVQAAMHAAMRPDAATAASRDVAVRAVEQGAVLVGCPAGAQVQEQEGQAGGGGGGGGGAAASSSGGWRLAAVPVVLQMPRGNLEGISPRALVLAALAAALSRGDFAEAWRLAAVQRVDLNLLVDWGAGGAGGWQAFAASAAAEFVAAVARPSDLCDLLFALRPGSVLEEGGAYAGALEWLGVRRPPPAAAAAAAGAAGQQQPKRPGPGAEAGGGAGARPGAAAEEGQQGGGGGGGGKVTGVCAAVRGAVLARPDAAKYLEVVVTSFARSDPPQLEEAMRAIRNAKEAELTGAASNGSATANGGAGAGAGATAAAGHSAADKALKHLLLYTDADELYRTALGMYDLPLAYMVVVASPNKDPGEALAELQRFGAIAPQPLQRYSIDMHLRRHASALGHLVAAGPQHFGQALQLARERGLLRQLLQLYDNDPAHRPAVLEAYGEQLEAAKRHDDAAVTYLAAGAGARALAAYRAGGRWRQVFTVAAQLGMAPDEVQALAADVAEELAASGQVADAAAVLLNYLGDVDNAVRTYATAREWREAVRVAHAHGRGDLVETVVAPAAAEGASALLAEAGEAVEKIRKYGQRLADVRARRLAMAAALAAADEEADAAGVDFDAQSDAMSLVSGLSVYTDATHTAPPGSAASASASGASRAPSTLGGRRAQGGGKKKKAGAGRIRQGSPMEEASLCAHLHSLAPRPSTLTEAGQLLELLVMLGHPDDARALQRAVAGWQAAYQAARADMAAHPVPVEGPPHAREEMERLLAPAPDTSGVAWKWEVLRDWAGP